MVLNNAIGTMSSAFRNAFDKFDLTIKWKRGKCEAMVRYRGRSASRHLDARRTEDGLLIIVDHTTALHVVTEYKHLGGVTTDSGCIMPEINQRVSSAMSPYGPGIELLCHRFRCCTR